MTPAPRLTHRERETQARLDYIARLRWAHGDARAAEIVAGRDPAMNEDLAKWRNLGRGQRP